VSGQIRTTDHRSELGASRNQAISSRTQTVPVITPPGSVECKTSVTQQSTCGKSRPASGGFHPQGAQCSMVVAMGSEEGRASAEGLVGPAALRGCGGNARRAAARSGTDSRATGGTPRPPSSGIGVSFVVGCEAGAVWWLSDASLGATRRWPGGCRSRR